METDLDLTDLVILQYIQQACGATNMCHKLDSNGNPQVWVNHQKLIEDLPILRISEGTLRNRLSALNQKGYVRSTVVANESGRGSKTYYGITDMTMSLIYDTVERPCHFKMTSDSLLNINNNNSISKDIELEKKPKKKNLFEKCIDAINNFTEDEDVREILIGYLKYRLEVKDKPLYANQWIGMLNKLREYTESKTECIAIIQQSIDRGYLSFYPISKNRACCDNNVKCVTMSEDDKQKQEEFVENMRKRGKQIEF